MAANVMGIGPRSVLYFAILEEIRSWSDFPRRIFTQAHYAGKSIEEIAQQSGCESQEVLQILTLHESKLRKSLKRLRGSGSRV